MDLKTLRLFVAVCDSRNMALVAEREHMTPSALTKRLHKLEEEVGVPLLRRVFRGMEATPAGLLLLEKGRALLSSAQEISEELESFSGGSASGVVTVMGSYAMTAGRLVEDIGDFLTTPGCEQVRVKLVEQAKGEIAQAVRDGRAAIGVLWDATDTSGLHMTPYHDDHIALVVHRSHALAERRLVSYTEAVAGETVRTRTTRQIELMLERTGAIAQAARHNRVEVPSFEAVLRLLRGGRYAALVPAEVARQYVQAFDLVIVPLADAWARRQHVLACQDPTTLSPAALALWKLLCRSAGPTTAPTPGGPLP